ncbi:hypothetical protein [Rubrivirga sp.]|uniref:hypothetical protein n=1 Tax=Rubrivirga sp. TaxID=1885344 RepID=UPI003C72ED90
MLRLALLVAFAAPLAAQPLPSGTWTGTLTDGDGDRSAVTAEIERCTGGFALVLEVGGRTAVVPETAPATWTRGRLQFETERVRMPGTVLPRALACDLEADDDGVLGGTCSAGRFEYALSISPPSNASFGCD